MLYNLYYNFNCLISSNSTQLNQSLLQ